MSSPTQTQENVFSGPLSIAKAAGLTAAFEGDLTVTQQLSDCELDISGSLNADGATIAGGSIRAHGQPTAGTLGSRDGAPTSITLCASQGPMEKLSAALKVLAEEQTAITSLQQRIALLEEDSSQFNHSEREEMTLAMFDMPDHEAAIQRLEALTTLAHERFGGGDAPAGVSLTVNTVLHAGVTVAFDGTDATWTCDTDMMGPLVIRLDDQGVMTAQDSTGDIQPLISNSVDEQKAPEDFSDDGSAPEATLLDDTVYRSSA